MTLKDSFCETYFTFNLSFGLIVTLLLSLIVIGIVISVLICVEDRNKRRRFKRKYGRSSGRRKDCKKDLNRVIAYLAFMEKSGCLNADAVRTVQKMRPTKSADKTMDEYRELAKAEISLFFCKKDLDFTKFDEKSKENSTTNLEKSKGSRSPPTLSPDESPECSKKQREGDKSVTATLSEIKK